jgi:hypothetical protein
VGIVKILLSTSTFNNIVSAILGLLTKSASAYQLGKNNSRNGIK